MLRKSERIQFLICTGAQESITRWVEEENTLTPEEKRLFRTGRSFIKKGLKTMVERLVVEDPDATKQLMSDAKRQYLALTPKRTNLQTRVTVDGDALELICNMVVNDCQERPEEWCRENHKICELKKALVGCTVQYRNREKGCRTCRYRDKTDE